MSGITNPAEPYFKDGTWGWDGTRWRKLPMVWGYSERYANYQVSANVTAGDHSLTFTSPAAGEVVVILGVHAWDSQTVITRIELTQFSYSASAHLMCKASPVIDEGLNFVGQVVLEEGDGLRVDFTGCALNDDIRGFAWGYVMKVTE